MSVSDLIGIIQALATLLIWIIIAASILSFFLPPYHPAREALDRIVDPLLYPIRQVVPMAGMMDFSPLILILIIQLLSNLLISILR